MGGMRSWRSIQDERDPQDEPDKHAADDYVARIVSNVRELDELVSHEGLVLGAMNDETVLEQLKRVERRLAEIRDTLQKRVAGKKGDGRSSSTLGLHHSLVAGDPRHRALLALLEGSTDHRPHRARGVARLSRGRSLRRSGELLCRCAQPPRHRVGYASGCQWCGDLIASE